MIKKYWINTSYFLTIRYTETRQFNFAYFAQYMQCARSRNSDLFHFEMDVPRVEFNKGRMSLSVRLARQIHPNGARKRFALSSRNFKTTRYEATIVVRRFQPAQLFRERQILGGCKADFALRRSTVERRHNNDNYYYKFAQDVRASPKFDVNAAPCGINVGLVFSRLDSLRFVLATILREDIPV